jgi:hypothetical protein
MNTLYNVSGKIVTRPIIAAGIACLLWQCVAAAAEYKPGIAWDEPKLVAPGTSGGPPSDAIVLFNGKDMSAWEHGDLWIVKEGYVIADKKSIQTKQSFGDVQLHLEYAAPQEATGQGQGRGNSGVLFMAGRYEVQILDSYNNPTYFDGQAAAIYKQHPPLVNACRKPGEWQTYDIVFMVPQFDLQGRLVEPAYATVFHNGVLVQNHFKLAGNTPFNQPPSYVPHPAKLPLELQYHRNPVRFRNIWIREIKEIDGTRVAEPMIERAPDKPAAPKPPDHKGPSPAR